MVASHLSFPSAANAAEGTAIAAGVLAFKTLGTEPLRRLRSRGWGACAAEPFRTTTAKCCISPHSSSAAETIRHRSICIGNAQPVRRIVRPYIRPAETRMKVAKAVAMEEAGIQNNAAAKPVRPPPPTKPTPQAPSAAKVKSEVNAREKKRNPRPVVDTEEVDNTRTVAVPKPIPDCSSERKPFQGPAA